MKYKNYEINFSYWIHKTAINYLDRQGLDIRCTKVEVDEAGKNYNLTFTYQCVDLVESFNKVDLEFADRPEPIIKYICNKANHVLTMKGVD